MLSACDTAAAVMCVACVYVYTAVSLVFVFVGSLPVAFCACLPSRNTACSSSSMICGCAVLCHAVLWFASVFVQVSGVTCTIVIKRYAAQYVMSAIMPIVASVWLGFVVFLLPR